MTRSRTSSPAGGALLRLPVDADHWAEDLPPVPDGFVVTVSCSSADVAAAHGEALTQLGFTLAGVHRPQRDPDEPLVEVVVHADLIDLRTVWWRTMAARSTAAYNLQAGPVAALFADVIGMHDVARQAAIARAGGGRRGPSS